MFSFHPYLGKISHLTNIFQLGWNHQLETNRSRSLGVCNVTRLSKHLGLETGWKKSRTGELKCAQFVVFYIYVFLHLAYCKYCKSIDTCRWKYQSPGSEIQMYRWRLLSFFGFGLTKNYPKLRSGRCFGDICFHPLVHVLVLYQYELDAQIKRYQKMVDWHGWLDEIQKNGVLHTSVFFVHCL